MEKIGILGAGTWGVALARMLYNCGHNIIVWSPLLEEVKELDVKRRQRNLPNLEIPAPISFTTDIARACIDRDIIVFAVPSPYIRTTAAKATSHITDGTILVNVSKGIECNTLYTMTQVIGSEMEKAGKECPLVALSGPTHAEEVAMDLPTTIVAACSNLSVAETVQNAFMSPCFRVYTNPDIQGVELCGALKNIIALAAGIATGLGYGDNSKAALITRGMAEIARLGKAMGCYEKTFSGLSGIGDLVVTATSQHSRNNRCGELIGKGLNVEDAVMQIGMVVEGINALPAAIALANRYNVSMPIVESVNEIITMGKSPKDVVVSLMNRSKRSEIGKSDNNEYALLQYWRSTGMKRVITYGTYDLLHYGHINLLRRAKALGDYLIVVLSSDEFNWNEKHKKTYFTYEQRKQLLESIRYVDLVIPETNWEQKRTDVHEYHIDTFVMGDDWKGKFDFLKEEGVEVVYLPRTPEISSSQMKKDLHDTENVDGESKLSHDDINTDPLH